MSSDINMIEETLKTVIFLIDYLKKKYQEYEKDNFLKYRLKKKIQIYEKIQIQINQILTEKKRLWVRQNEQNNKSVNEEIDDINKKLTLMFIKIKDIIEKEDNILVILAKTEKETEEMKEKSPYVD